MKRISLRTSVTACLLAGALTLGAAATVGVQEITANLRPDITVSLNGESQTMYDKNGDVVYPIEYGGSTYLPIRALGNLLGQSVAWDSKTQTVLLTTKAETPPEELTNAALTKRAGTLESDYAVLLADVEATGKTGSYAENLLLYRALDNRRLALRSSLRVLQVDGSEAYRADKITLAQRDALLDRLDHLDGKLERLSKTLLDKYGIMDENATYRSLRDEAAALGKDQSALDTLVAAAKDASTRKAWSDANGKAAPAWKSFRDGVSALQVALNDSLRQGILTYEQYNELSTLADKLDVACKDFQSILDAAEDKWSGADKPDKDWENQDAEDYANKIAGMQDRADKLLKACRDYRDGADGLSLLRQIDTLDHEIDTLEHAIERSDKLGRQARWELLRSLDRAEDTLDRAEDLLERAGVDDDDWDDRDDHDDWDDHDDDDWDD